MNVKVLFFFICALYASTASCTADESTIAVELSGRPLDSLLSSASSDSFNVVSFVSILEPLFVNFTGENYPQDTCRGKPTSCGKLFIALDYELFRLKTCLEPALEEIRGQLQLIDAESNPFVDADEHIMAPLRERWSTLSACWHGDSADRQANAQALGLSLPSLSYLRHFLIWAYTQDGLRYFLNPLTGRRSLSSLRDFLRSLKGEHSFRQFTYILNQYFQLIPTSLLQEVMVTCYDHDLIYESHQLVSNAKSWKNASQCEVDLCHYFGSFSALNGARMAHNQCSHLFGSERSMLASVFDQLSQFIRVRFVADAAQEPAKPRPSVNDTTAPVLPPQSSSSSPPQSSSSSPSPSSPS